jgi:hypothetical protein
MNKGVWVKQINPGAERWEKLEGVVNTSQPQPKVYERSWLFSLLAINGCCPVVISGVTGIVDSIQREDGSGKSFNVAMNTKGGAKVVHVRTE